LVLFVPTGTETGVFAEANTGGWVVIGVGILDNVGVGILDNVGVGILDSVGVGILDCVGAYNEVYCDVDVGICENKGVVAGCTPRNVL